MKNKAFTLIELLAVITILGLLMFIALPIVNNLTTGAEDDTLALQTEYIKEAAKAYFIEDTDNVAPIYLWETARVSLSKIIEKGYIDPMVNPSTNENCDYNDSYVDIGKGEVREFIYNVYLKCGDYEYINKNTQFKINEYKIKYATKKHFEANGGYPADGVKAEVTYANLSSYLIDFNPVESIDSDSKGIIENNGGEYTYLAGLLTPNYLSVEGWNIIS